MSEAMEPIEGAWALRTEQVQQALQPIALVRQVYFFEEIGSTNDWCKELITRAGSGADLHGTFVIASHQSAGRGRYQRRWEAPWGKAVLFSAILDPSQAPMGRSGCEACAGASPEELVCNFGRWLSVMCPVAISEGIRGVESLAARIKYPNDILINGKKAAGILIEQCRNGERTLFVLGIGINVNQHSAELPPGTRTPATSLALEIGRELPLIEVLGCVMRRLDFWLSSPRGASAAARMNALCDTVGQLVEVRMHQGSVSGVAMAVASDGGLVVRTESGIEQVLYSGDIEQIRLR